MRVFFFSLLLFCVTFTSIYPKHQQATDNTDKIAVISDSHGFPLFLQVLEGIKSQGYNAILIAGDLEGNTQDVIKFLEKYPDYPVVILPGDHDIDAVDVGIPEQTPDIIDVISRVKTKKKKNKNISWQALLTDLKTQISSLLTSNQSTSLNEMVKELRQKINSGNRKFRRIAESLLDSYKTLLAISSMDRFVSRPDIKTLIDKGVLILNIKLKIQVPHNGYTIFLNNRKLPKLEYQLQDNIKILPLLMLTKKMSKKIGYVSRILESYSSIESIPETKTVILSHLAKSSFCTMCKVLNQHILFNGHTHFIPENDKYSYAKLLGPISHLYNNDFIITSIIDDLRIERRYISKENLIFYNQKQSPYKNSVGFIKVDNSKTTKLAFLSDYFKSLVKDITDNNAQIILSKSIINRDAIPNKGFVQYEDLVLALWPMDKLVVINLKGISNKTIRKLLSTVDKDLYHISTTNNTTPEYFITTSLSLKVGLLRKLESILGDLNNKILFEKPFNKIFRAKEQTPYLLSSPLADNPNYIPNTLRTFLEDPTIDKSLFFNTTPCGTNFTRSIESLFLLAL